MVLKINLGIEREKRLMEHLKKEHPSVRGHICIKKGTKKSINKIISNVPNYEKQAKNATKLIKLLKGGKK